MSTRNLAEENSEMERALCPLGYVWGGLRSRPLRLDSKLGGILASMPRSTQGCAVLQPPAGCDFKKTFLLDRPRLERGKVCIFA